MSTLTINLTESQIGVLSDEVKGALKEAADEVHESMNWADSLRDARDRADRLSALVHLMEEIRRAAGAAVAKEVEEETYLKREPKEMRGSDLKRLRLSRGMTQKKAAEIMETAQANYSRLERSESLGTIHPGTILKIRALQKWSQDNG